MKYRTEYVAPIGAEGLHIVDTAAWRSRKPLLANASCIRCGLCFLSCPVGSVILDELGYSIDYSFCKGCGICAHECPTQSIAMIEEGSHE